MSNKSFYLFIFALISFSLIVRYPVTINETGEDSFLYHVQAEILTSEGKIVWLYLSFSDGAIFSLMGLYPFSDTNAGPILISTLSQVMGTPIEITILFLSSSFGITGALGILILTLFLKRDTIYSISSAMVFTATPIFVSYTHYSFSTRAMILVLLPYLLLFIFSLFSSDKRLGGPRSKILIIIIISLILAFSHNMFFFVPLVFFSIILSFIIQQSKRGRNIFNFVRKPYAYVLLSLILLSLPLYFDFFTRNIEDFETGYFFDGDSKLVIIVNMLTVYAFHMGVLSPIGLLSIFFLCEKIYSSYNDIFVGISILILIPFCFDDLYFLSFSVIFISIIIGYGLSNIFKRITKAYERTKIFPIFVAVLFLALFFPSLYDFDFGRTTPTTSDYHSTKSKETGLYLSHNLDSLTIVFGDNRKVSAYSKALVPYDWNTDIIYQGKITKDDLNIERKYSFSDFLERDGLLHVANDWTSNEPYWQGKAAADFTFNEYDSIEAKRRILTAFDVQYCAISNIFLESQEKENERYYSVTGNLKDDEIHRFVESVLESDNYILYNNGHHSLYKIY